MSDILSQIDAVHRELGKSGDAYMKQFTGGDDYWDRVIAAQRDWHPKQSANDAAPDPPSGLRRG